MEQCDNDADTSIVRAALAAATDNSVEVSILILTTCLRKAICLHSSGRSVHNYLVLFQVMAEDTDVLVANASAPLLKHHSSTLLKYIEGFLRCQQDP